MTDSAPPISVERTTSPFPARSAALVICQLLLATTLGCGGGGDDDDQSPSGPGAPTAVLGGTWEGTSTTTSAQGTCLADQFQGGLAVSARWQFSQSGQSATGQLTLNRVVTCQFRATISGPSVSIFAVPTNNSCTVYAAVCQSAPGRQLRVEIRTDVPALTGRVEGTNLTLNGPTRSRVYDTQTGRELGEYSVGVVHQLRKTS